MAAQRHSKDRQDARHARSARGAAHAGAASSWWSSLTWPYFAIALLVAIALVVLAFFGISSCGRAMTLGAWQREVAHAAELTTSAIEAGYKDQMASLEVPRKEAENALDSVVADIEGQGYDVGYYVATADGRELFSKNADEVFYAASSIKGPFVLTTFTEGVPAESRYDVEEAIRWSDNEAYWRLRNIYGSSVLSSQLEDMGVSELTAHNSFVHLTPAQLANLWLKNYWVLDSSPDAEWLQSIFANPVNAPIAALSEKSYSKGGWIETEDLNCTVDAGIVDHGENRYVMSAMISAGEDEPLLERLVKAIDAYKQADYAYLKASGELG